MPIFSNHFQGLRTVWNERDKPYSFDKHQYFINLFTEGNQFGYYASGEAARLGDRVGGGEDAILYYRMLYLGTPPIEQSKLNGKRICGKKSVPYSNFTKDNKCQSDQKVCPSTAY